MNACTNTRADPVSATDGEMSEADWAALDFEPWVHTPDEWKPPSDIEWANLANPHLVTIRIAWMMLHKTKAELVETMEAMEEQNLFVSTMDRIQDTSDWLKGLSHIVNGAKARVICAGMTAVGEAS